MLQRRYCAPLCQRRSSARSAPCPCRLPPTPCAMRAAPLTLRFMTSLCPDKCNHPTDWGVFSIKGYLEYEKPGGGRAST